MDYDLEADLRALEAMASNLTPYLYENELYGTLSPNLPSLTVGGLLLRLHRLKGLEDSLDSDQHQRLRDAQLNFEQQRTEWMVHYESKLQQELNARMGNLGAYLDDYENNPAQAGANYPVEATRRTIIHHLQQQAEQYDVWTEEFGDRLRKLDRRLLSALSRTGGNKFIWASELQPLYPEDTFWWLYRYPAD